MSWRKWKKRLKEKVNMKDKKLMLIDHKITKIDLILNFFVYFTQQYFLNDM